MKLYYYQQQDFKQKVKISNFGDDLNPWIWNQLIPEIFEVDDKNYFVGAGTILNNNLAAKIPDAKNIIVFGSGYGYGTEPPVIDEHWSIYALRGPLSAQALGVNNDRAVIDSGILIRRLFQREGPQSRQIAYMPHVSFIRQADQAWQMICEDLDLLLIDPRWSLESVMAAIAEAPLLLTEAMHGAIAAEAFGTPWVALQTSPRILTFKWQDWCASIGIKYQPEVVDLELFYVLRAFLNPFTFSRASQNGYPLADKNKTCSSRRLKLRYNWAYSKAIQSLNKIIKTARPVETDPKKVENQIIKLEERLEQFRNDFKSGKFTDDG